MKVVNVHVRYLVTESKGDPVLLIHGLGGSIESWINNVEAISSHNFQVIALDLPGFGLSDKPKIAYSTEYYSKFISKFIRQLRIDSHSLCIIGNSLGGQIAAEFAIKYPLEVSKLVLTSPAGTLPFLFKGTPELRNYVNIVQANTVQQVRRDLSGIDKNVESIEYNYAKMFFHRLKLPRAKEAFISAFCGSAQAPRLNDRLHKIKAKTLLLWGKDDRIIPVNFFHPFIKMKNCRVILLENCGHSVPMNSSMLFNKFVIDFLKE
ncbi:MAG TPA: alpha/beta hydrolase [Candidatus Nitrosopolaris sp.]|nr:alpha/beta hydrolase [Candidatus Nitrosopolaris sp.]